MKLISDEYLMHYGVKGMKWGVRHDPEPSEKRIRKLEKKAIKKEYKRWKKNGGWTVFPGARISTGENYNKASDNFQKIVANDKKYKELSKKAFDAEKKRLLSEKSYVNDDLKYDRYVNSSEYKKLNDASEKAYNAKENRVKELAKQYTNTIKEAKLNDLNIKENRDIAKQYISDRFDDFYWDGNLEYNPDSYYESGLEKVKFR